MHLLYCDETNLQERSGDFFVYAGVIIEAARARDLSHRIDTIRAGANVPPEYRLKFNPGPAELDHQHFIELKKSIIAAAIDANVRLLVSAILHNVATSPDQARRNEINRLCFHFDCFLNRTGDPGLVLIDRFNDAQIDAHLAEKFSVGLTGMPHSPRLRLSNIVGFHYSAVGQSHFCSLIDVVIGSLRFAINAFTRGGSQHMESAKLILTGLEPLFYRERDGAPVSELSFFFSPRSVWAPPFRRKYTDLKAFLAESGIDTAQLI
ncbi:DUF3800 domain-containing protein [Bradyrhizobium sp. 173]|uniref:DUF3800 domain-containing protein n=1 Tax=Bradyrhizobium sp. 173 TaxID=2782644 RepID=UPI001FFAAB03|nr:DUF3800 domain-containing protein [Bradyrhizobium sp. 173]MCK1568818.1 DUF3800 domain-containing protein [Bradyrhizobium sp. 173]